MLPKFSLWGDAIFLANKDHFLSNSSHKTAEEIIRDYGTGSFGCGGGFCGVGVLMLMMGELGFG